MALGAGPVVLGGGAVVIGPVGLVVTVEQRGGQIVGHSGAVVLERASVVSGEGTSEPYGGMFGGVDHVTDGGFAATTATADLIDAFVDLPAAAGEMVRDVAVAIEHGRSVRW